MKYRQSGQVLLVGLMVTALIATVIVTGTLRVTTTTRLSKQSEDSQKAASVARSIAEGSLNNETFVGGDFSDIVENATSKELINDPAGYSFVTSEIVSKDSQYFFYTTDYDEVSATFGTSYYSGDVTVYFHSEGAPACPVIELILINATDEIAGRYYSATCGANNISSVSTGQLTNGAGTTLNWEGKSYVFDKSVRISLVSATAVKGIFVRPLFAATRLGFVTSAATPAQGVEVRSTARTKDGSQSTQKIFKRYPQLPQGFAATVY